MHTVETDVLTLRTTIWKALALDDQDEIDAQFERFSPEAVVTHTAK